MQVVLAPITNNGDRATKCLQLKAERLTMASNCDHSITPPSDTDALPAGGGETVHCACQEKSQFFPSTATAPSTSPYPPKQPNRSSTD